MAKESDPRVAALGLHIRGIREGAGLSQAELARRSGISRMSLHTLEAGTGGSPNFSTLLWVADALGVGVHLLIPKSRPMPPRGERT